MVFVLLAIFGIFIAFGRLIGMALGISEVRKNQERIISLLEKATRQPHWTDQYKSEE